MRGTMRKKFVCPVCGEKVGGPVRDTEPRYSDYFRYRECENCGVVFVTEEKVTKAILKDGKIKKPKGIYAFANFIKIEKREVES